MLWSYALPERDLFVLDLIQLADGQRLIIPRKPDAPPHVDRVFSTKAYFGDDLMSWRAYLQLPKYVELEDGNKFLLEAHGAWLTLEEGEYLFRGATSSASPPWVNGIPPSLPPE